MEESKIMQMFKEQGARILALEAEIKNLDFLMSAGKDGILPCPVDCDTCPVTGSCTRNP